MRLGSFAHAVLLGCSLVAACSIERVVFAQAAPALQPKAADTITLAELLKRARKDPPAVRRALADIERARADLSAAKAGWYPAFSAEGVVGLRYSNQFILPGYPRFD